jgi:hypothetical protein
MRCTKLGLLLLVSVIFSQYNTTGQETTCALNWWADEAGQCVPPFQDHFTIGADDWQNAKTFHIVVIGDSIAWGCGLDKIEKYSYLVADWFQKELKRPVDVTVLAHTGATFEVPEDKNKKHTPILILSSQVGTRSSGNKQIKSAAKKM